MIEALRAWIDRRLSRGATPPRGLPPGVDEVRLLKSANALKLAELAGIIGALDQSIVAMRSLEADRAQSRASTDPVTDLALLRFAIVQFVDCFTARRGSARLTPKKAFDEAGVKFFGYVVEFANQLSGAHARVVGETETVVLLKRSGERAGVIGLTTRARRPERLTRPELASLAAFMETGRAAYAGLFDDTRQKVMDEVERMTSDGLLSLERRES
ncbi:hypothetical protein GCM10009422_28460 [Brevundimonas kwangchunensis]|uniref:Uncharacterized protein n=1 Tax=Brevundimonas kwangchunensis TaxID=322163 RepID=A0ABN1H5A6_9CAUL